MAELITRCSDTLEHLKIQSDIRSTLDSAPSFESNVFLKPLTADKPLPGIIDLSKATKLKDMTFPFNGLSSRWMIMALESITSEHRDLRKITIEPPYKDGWVEVPLSAQAQLNVAKPGVRWSDADRLLVQLSETWSIRPEVQLLISGRDMKWAEYLLPEVMKKGYYVIPTRVYMHF